MRTTRPRNPPSGSDVTYVIRSAPLELQNKDGQAIPDIVSVNVTAHWKEGREEQHGLGGDLGLPAACFRQPREGRP